MFLWGEQHDIVFLQVDSDQAKWSWTLFVPIALGLLYIQISGGIRIEIHKSGIAYYTRIRKPYWWSWDAYGLFVLNTQIQRSFRRLFLSKALIRVCANKMVPGGQSETVTSWSTADISLSISGFPAGKSISAAEMFVQRINDARQLYFEKQSI